MGEYDVAGLYFENAPICLQRAGRGVSRYGHDGGSHAENGSEKRHELQQRAAPLGQVARQWNLIHPRGSPEWNALLQELQQLGTILDPTMVAYLASRDVMRARSAEWHAQYTLPGAVRQYASPESVTDKMST